MQNLRIKQECLLFAPLHGINLRFMRELGCQEWNSLTNQCGQTIRGIHQIIPIE
jgi:hypothetical protein